MLSTSEAGRALCSSCLSHVPRKTSMGSREKSGPPWLPKKDSEPVYLQEPRPEHHPLPQAKKNLVLGFKPENSEPSAAACEVAWPRVQCNCMTEHSVSSPSSCKKVVFSVSRKHLSCAGSDVSVAREELWAGCHHSGVVYAVKHWMSLPCRNKQRVSK